MTAFTKLLATLNLFGFLASISLFIGTWFERSYIVGKARDYAIEKAKVSLEPVAKIFQNQIPGKLPEPINEKLKREIADYRASPDNWWRKTIESSRDRAEDLKFPEVRNPLARTPLDFLTKYIAGARQRFKTSYDHLILDLRIFSGTNACAFLLATALCFLARTRQMRYWLGMWSAILLLGTVFAGWLYTGQNWLWAIVANDYMGWSYPGVHFAITFYLILQMLPTLEARAPVKDG